MIRRAPRLNRAASVVVLAASIASAQQPPPSRSLQFEAAAIKPGDPNHMGALFSGGAPGGRYRIVNAPLRQWVEKGLSVPDYALKAPAWLDSTNFDLDARLPNQPLDQNSLAEMMKSLLVERFGLRWHEETQPASGYELVADKMVLVPAASLMERLRGSGGGWSSGPTTVKGTNLTMSKVAELLGEALKRPVVDATHLSGGYDINLTWRPDDETELARQRQYGKQYGIDVDNLPDSVFTAVREQLGLRLQPAKVPAKVIVIDQINHQPTGN